MNIIAFDPGLKGGIAFFKQVRLSAYMLEGQITAEIMPVAGKEIDIYQIAELLREQRPDICVIEKVHSMPSQGVASTFTFGKGYGSLIGICVGLGIRTELVTPQAWKGLVLKGTDKSKDAAIAYCRRAFPKVPLIPDGCRTPKDGIADALCILEYARRTYG